MVESTNKLLRAIYCTLRGLPRLGVSSSLKFLYANLSRSEVKIRPKGSKQFLRLRGGTSDVETFFSIVIRQAYPRLDRQIAIIVDAGANVGYSAVVFAQNYPNAKIFAIEPEPGNFELLVKNTSAYSNIIAINGALWSESRELYLQDANAELWAFQYGLENKTSKKTKAYSVGDLMKDQNISSIDILKMDIEGAEKQIFAGETSWLNDVDTMFIEIHDRIVEGAGQQIFKVMSKFKYEFDVRFEYVIFDRIQRLDQSHADRESVYRHTRI